MAAAIARGAGWRHKYSAFLLSLSGPCQPINVRVRVYPACSVFFVDYPLFISRLVEASRIMGCSGSYECDAVVFGRAHCRAVLAASPPRGIPGDSAMFGAHITCACHRVRVVYVIGECFYGCGQSFQFLSIKPLELPSPSLVSSWHVYWELEKCSTIVPFLWCELGIGD